MQTRSSSNSPPQSVTSSSQRGHSGAPASGGEAAVRSTPTAPALKHSQWNAEEERELIDFLSDHKAEAGDGATFKHATWTQAAAHMSALHPSIIYSATQCSSKWGRVRQYFPLQYLLLIIV